MTKNHASPKVNPMQFLSYGFILLWSIVALFPIFWIVIMSVKVPLDAFASNPFLVLFGINTAKDVGGFSILDILIGGASIWYFVKFSIRLFPKAVDSFSIRNMTFLGWLVVPISCIVIFVILFFGVLSGLLEFLNSISGPLGTTLIGFTEEHYQAVWIENEFYQNFKNSIIVTSGVVILSLSVGTLAGYGLARSNSNLAFWLLILALIFRALPHSVLVSGYLPFFINSAEYLSFIFGENAPTLYGQPYAIIFVLVAINQPFTIWMLKSFFSNIPVELDEAAKIDGCSSFKAFRLVIIPVMWPGVVTAGLFSFLLGYNDYLVTSLLLDTQNQTMVPAITSYFNRETTMTDQMEATAAAVSIIAPLFFLVLAFQRQIVSGLTSGAVKG